jgi:hypothetical protein
MLARAIVVATLSPLLQPAYAERLTFDKTKNLSHNPVGSFNPQIAVSENGNNVYVVWMDQVTIKSAMKCEQEEPGCNFDILFRRGSI